MQESAQSEIIEQPVGYQAPESDAQVFQSEENPFSKSSSSEQEDIIDEDVEKDE